MRHLKYCYYYKFHTDFGFLNFNEECTNAAMQHNSLTSRMFNSRLTFWLIQTGRCTDSHVKTGRLLYQPTHPQDVTVAACEAQAPGFSSYASSM